jgi:hypothetical protein
LFVAQQVTAGQAVWTRSAVSAYPVDAVGGTAPVAAYGTRKLRAAYTGNALNVTRASDSTTLAIGFIAGGALDTATLDAFCAGTTCTVNAWYDQSGNGNDATQTTVANQPSLSPASLSGNARSIIFDSQINNSPYVLKYMVLPSGVAVGGTAQSAFVLGRAYSSERAAIYLSLANASYPTVLASAAINNSPWAPPYTPWLTYVGNVAGPVGPLSQTWQLLGYTLSTSAFNVFLNEAQTTLAFGQASYPQVGGWLGASAATIAGARYTGYNEQSAVLIYGRALNATAEVPNLRASLALNFQTYPQIRDVCVVDGNSETEGYQSTLLQNRTRQLIALLDRPCLVANKGFYGDTMAHRATNYATDIAPMYNAAATNNILEIFAGRNDNTGSDTTGASIYANLTAYIASAHATGWKVLAATMLPYSGDSANQTAERLAYNALIRANAAGADGIIDYAADPLMGLQATTTNTMYYGDGLHPTSLGYGYLAQIEAAAFNALLK